MRNYISGILGEEFPVSRMIGKNLAKGHLLPHWELLEKYDAKGRDGFDWRTTQYYQRMVNLNITFPVISALFRTA